MLTDGDLDNEQASKPYQSSRLYQAVDNVKAAHEIERGNAIATLAYDAARAAVDVHANVAGLKISGKDQHQNAVEYTYSAMADLVDTEQLDVYAELRMVRNRVVEYPPIGGFAPPTTEEASRYLAAADRLVTAVQRWWREQP